MNPITKFIFDRKKRINEQATDKSFQLQTQRWLEESIDRQYVYNFEWLGRPIIQYPQDILALQEIIWTVKPDLVIETGIAHGGSLIFSASMLKLLGGNRKVVGIDVDIRPHNRAEIENHPMFSYIDLIQGSSTDPIIVSKIKAMVSEYQNILVILDSNHTHEHVLSELHLYGNFVSKNSYLIVLDSFIENMPSSFYKNRSWGIGNNPKTAIHEFLSMRHDFSINYEFENKLMITSAPSGFLKKSI